MTKENYDFMMPNVNFFGAGVVKKVGERAKMLNMNKVLIVTDKFLRELANG
ncbi:iron-containing alcohol dehydrogenase, partial [Listeria monocytogenes]|nr:iron-containing alcohol dehydrogenase [Listeria monocytogenes]